MARDPQRRSVATMAMAAAVLCGGASLLPTSTAAGGNAINASSLWCGPRQLTCGFIESSELWAVVTGTTPGAGGGGDAFLVFGRHCLMFEGDSMALANYSACAHHSCCFSAYHGPDGCGATALAANEAHAALAPPPLMGQYQVYNVSASGTAGYMASCTEYQYLLAFPSLDYQDMQSSSGVPGLCAPLTGCSEFEYQLAPPRCCSGDAYTLWWNTSLPQPNQTADDVCGPHVNCTQNLQDSWFRNGTYYLSGKPLQITDRVCLPMTDGCLVGQYMEQGPTPTSDTICASVSPPCDNATAFQVIAPTPTSDRVCYNDTFITDTLDCTRIGVYCEGGIDLEHLQLNPTFHLQSSIEPGVALRFPAGDAVCLTEIGTTQYAIVPREQCLSLDGGIPLYFVPNRLASDPVCCFTSTPTCTPAAAFANTRRSGRGCPRPGQYVVAEPTATSTRQCARQCGAQQRTASFPARAGGAPGECVTFPACDLTTQYEAVPAKCVSLADFNRWADNYTVGVVPVTDFCRTEDAVPCAMATPPGLIITPPVCTPLTPCDGSLYVATDATLTSDQVCGHRASTWDYVGPILAGVVLLVAVGVYLLRRGGEKIQMSLEMNERLLGDQERKQKGWMLSEAELTRGKQIAQGSFGVVHAGTWGHIDVAIKTHIDHGEPSALEEFQKEAEFMQSIRHPNMVTFYGVCTSTAGDLQLVFELCDKGSMRSLLQSPAELVWEQRLQFATDIAKGMKYLHGLDLVHRDIKSDNVLISDSGRGAARSPRGHYNQAVHGTTESPSLELPTDMAPAYQLHAKVADFGQSRLVNSTRTDSMASGSTESGLGRETRTSSSASTTANTSFFNLAPSALRRTLSTREVPEDVPMAPEQMLTGTVGTPLWSAPELLSGSITYGKPIDVYSFAIIMWELVTRQEPWSDIPYENPFSFHSKLEAAVVSGRRPELSSEFAWPDRYLAMMQLCWHGHPEERPTFEQLVAELAVESSSANA